MSKKLQLQDAEVEFFDETKPVFPFNGCPMFTISKEDDCANFYIEFANNREIDDFIQKLESIKYKEDQH